MCGVTFVKKKVEKKGSSVDSRGLGPLGFILYSVVFCHFSYIHSKTFFSTRDFFL